MLRCKRSSQQIQSGAAMVEFAIIIPFLLLLVLGIIEFGYAFYHLNILNKSVQDAARYFSDPFIARKQVLTNPIDTSATNATNVTRTHNLVIYGNITGTGNPLMPNSANYNVTLVCAEENAVKECASTTQHIRVTATYQHNFILGSALSNFTDGTTPAVYNLTASSVLRVE